MKSPRISAVAAIGKNRELGKSNDLIWKLDADYNHMRKLIDGHVLIMGRKTYESIGRELPYSPSIVVTSNKEYVPPYKNTKRTTLAHSLEDALSKAADIELQSNNHEKEIIIFGGSHIYTKALPETERLYLTKINASDPEADTFFPEYTEFKNIINKTEHEENSIHFEFITLER